jgi:hypothetical protein
VTWTEQAYEDVRRSMHAAGFDHADAIYPCNIPEGDAAPFSHNLEWIVHHTEHFLRATRGAPFFAYVGWTLPHSPSVRRAMARSPAETVLSREVHGDGGWPTQRALQLRQQALEHVQLLAGTAHQTDISLAWIDTATGALLDTLDLIGRRNSTLVIFTSDHASTGKYSCLRGAQVPLLARWPGVIPPGIASTQLISHLDLLPAILEATGHMGALQQEDQGRSFLPAVGGASRPATPGRTHLFCETYLERSSKRHHESNGLARPTPPLHLSDCMFDSHRPHVHDRLACSRSLAYPIQWEQEAEPRANDSGRRKRMCVRPIGSIQHPPRWKENRPR